MTSSSSASATLSSPSITRSTFVDKLRWVEVKSILQRSLAIGVFFLLWELAPRYGIVNRSFLPPLSEILEHGYEFAIAGKLLPHILISLARSFGGFFLAVVVAVPLGILLGWSKSIDHYLTPLVEMLRQFNTLSLLPVFIMFFGIGYLTNVVIVFWVALWPILINTTTGVKYVDPILVKYGRSLSLSDQQIFVRIVLPSALSSIISGMRLAVTHSLLVLVLSEQVGASSGLGYLVGNAQYILGIHIMYLAILLLALLGFLANRSLILLENRLTWWKTDQQSHSGLGVKS